MLGAVLEKSIMEDLTMKIAFRKLALSLPVVLGVLAASPANAQAWSVHKYSVYKTSAGTTEGFVTFAGGTSEPIFFFSNPSADVLMALATAQQMRTAVAWFYGPGGSGPYGDFELQDTGKWFTAMELYKDPAALPSNVPTSTPYNIYVSNGGSLLTWSSTPNSTKQLITSDAWYNSYGYKVPVGTLAAIFNAFSGQYGVEITGFSPVTGITTTDCATHAGC